MRRASACVHTPSSTSVAQTGWVKSCEGGGEGCGGGVVLCGAGGGGAGSERLRVGDGGSTAARAGEGCEGSGDGCVGAGCTVGCGVAGCCAVAATGASPLRRWYAALRSKLRCCRALRAGCERAGSVDERLVEGGGKGGDVCDARCARGARALWPRRQPSSQCQDVMERVVAPRDVRSTISTFHAPSRAARRRWREAQARDAADAATAAVAARAGASASFCILELALNSSLTFGVCE